MKRATRWFVILALVLFPMAGFGAGAQAAAPVVIGAVQPLTGWASLDGLNTVAGLKIGVSQINAHGGVLGGRPLKLIIEDGKADPVESVNAVLDLINHYKVPAIMGCWASSATLASMPIVKKNHVPLLVAVSTAPLITEQKNKWVFRFTSNNDIDGALMAKYLVPKLGFKKSAYLAVNNDWGRSMAKAVSEIMQKTGGKVTMVEYCPGNETDFTPMLTRIKNSDVDSMFITTSYAGTAMIMKQYHELGMHKKVFVTSGLSAEKMVQLDGKKIMDGVYFFERYVPSSPPAGTQAQNKWLLARYKKLYPKGVPDMYVAFGYDDVHIMADAINRAGKLNSAAIRDALQKTDYLGLSGRVKFDANNDSQPRCSITQVRNGVNTIIYHLNNK